MITYMHTKGKPEIGLLSSIQTLYHEIFEFIDTDKFNKRMSDNEKLFTVTAWSDNQLIGFKTGYAIDVNIFYSWIGGVKREFRKSGIAQELMKQQHEWCLQHGFDTVRTKTMNRWKGMLILNLKTGFDITETYTDEKGIVKIILEKNLNY